MKKFTRFLFLTFIGWASVQCVLAQAWTPASVPTNSPWLGIASSADGNKLFAINQAYTYALSTNAGVTWSTNIEPQKGSSYYGSWSCIASSADGNTLMAINANALWVSTNGGYAWISNTVPGVNVFGTVALSADGTKAVAAEGSGQAGLIYTSTDSGMTWTHSQIPAQNWNSVASSADGTKLAAVALPVSSVPLSNPIYISTNSGLTWYPANTPASNIWFNIALSADGTRLAATTAPLLVNTNPYTYAPNFIYTSTNAGASWLAGTGLPTNTAWDGIASSADGSQLLAVAQNNLGGGIYTSTNYGATWISNSSPALLWWSAASSADGSKLAATYIASTFNNGGIYTSQTAPSPQLKIAATSGLQLSWTIPSTNLVLQQRTNLSAGTWTDITNQPILNLTNLQNQVTLLVTNTSGFYRLH